MSRRLVGFVLAASVALAVCGSSTKTTAPTTVKPSPQVSLEQIEATFNTAVKGLMPCAPLNEYAPLSSAAMTAAEAMASVAWPTGAEDGAAKLTAAFGTFHIQHATHLAISIQVLQISTEDKILRQELHLSTTQGGIQVLPTDGPACSSS